MFLWESTTLPRQVEMTETVSSLQTLCHGETIFQTPSLCIRYNSGFNKNLSSVWLLLPTLRIFVVETRITHG